MFFVVSKNLSCNKYDLHKGNFNSKKMKQLFYNSQLKHNTLCIFEKKETFLIFNF